MCGGRVKMVNMDKKLSTTQCVPCLLLLVCKQVCLTENHLRVKGYVPVSVSVTIIHSYFDLLFHIYDVTSHYCIFLSSTSLKMVETDRNM
jgi:hypothetical protein